MFLLQLVVVILFFPFRHREDPAHGHVLLLRGEPSEKESPLQRLHVGHP